MMKISKNIKLVLIILGISVLAAVFFSRQAQALKTLDIKKGPIVEAVYGLGTVTATNHYDLKVGVSTAVKQIFVREGDQVAKGAPLISFDDVGIQTAPFTGTVTSIVYKLRENVFPQSRVLTLMDLKDRYITVSLEQQGALRVKKGQNAVLSFESLRGQKFEGVIRTVFPSEGQFFVYIDIANLPFEILPGMTADVAIEVARKAEATLVPLNAVASGQVTRVNRSGKKKIPVQLGIVDGEWAEVISGDLSVGDQVVVRGK